MKALNKGLLPAAIASACALLAVYSPAHANPVALTEVNDLLPGNKQNLRVVDNKLRFMSSYADGEAQPFTLDQNGVLEAVPYNSEEADYTGELFIDGRMFYSSPSFYSEPDELYSRIFVQDANGSELLLELPPYDNLDPANDGAENNRPYVASLYEKSGNLIAEVARWFYDESTGDEVIEITLYTINVDTGEVLATEEVARTNFSYSRTAGSWFVFNGNKYGIGFSNGIGGELYKIGPGRYSAEGTLLADINPGPAQAYISNFVEMDGAVYFLATAVGSGLGGRELYKLDADDNVQRVADIYPKGPAFTYDGLYNDEFHIYNNELYFLANHPDYGKELWKSDGTEQGTVLVAEAFAGAEGAVDTKAWPIEDVDQEYLGDALRLGYTAAGGFFYRLQDSEGVVHLWHTDGTASGTRYVMTEPRTYWAQDFFTLDGSFYVVYNNPEIDGSELWRISTGNDINPEKILTADRILALDTGRDYADRVLLRVVQPSEEELWALTGSAGELNKITTLMHNDEPAKYTFFAAKSDDKTFFIADTESTGKEMWVTDYTEAGTYLIKDILPGTGSGTYTGFSDGSGTYWSGPDRAVFDGKLYYYAQSAYNNYRLWVTDGTEAGTKEISSDVYGQWQGRYEPEGREMPNPSSFAFYNGSVYIPGPRIFDDTSDHRDDYSALYKYTPESSSTAPSGTGVLGDYVWQDANGDGIQSSDEFGLEGVVVELQSCDGTFVASTTTDSMGAYRFENLAQDNFQLQFNLPAGFIFSPEKAGSSYTLDSNANQTTGVSPCYDMSQGYQRLAVDAGMVPTDDDTTNGSIGDLVWQDINGDGVQDSNEPGLAGVTVNLSRCSGEFVATTESDSSGGYRFDITTPAWYSVSFELPAGYRYSPKKGTNDYAKDSNVNSAGQAGCYDMTNGWNRTAIDAGFVPTDDSSAETVAVLHAIYVSQDNKLWVQAESDLNPTGGSTITAVVQSNGDAIDQGPVTYKAAKGYYQTTFYDLAQVPDAITLVSDSGAEVTVNVEVR